MWDYRAVGSENECDLFKDPLADVGLEGLPKDKVHLDPEESLEVKSDENWKRINEADRVCVGVAARHRRVFLLTTAKCQIYWARRE